MRVAPQSVLKGMICCLLLWTGCAPKDSLSPTTARIEVQASNKEKPMTTTIEGVAMDANAGGVVAGDDFIVYVDGLLQWPDDIVGKRVRVTGELVKEKCIPDPGSTPPKSGALGSQSVLKNAKWELVLSGR